MDRRHRQLRRAGRQPTLARLSLAAGTLRVRLPDAPSDPLEFPPRPLVLDVAGVERGGRLEEEDANLFVRDGAVLDASRDDQEVSFVQPDVTVPEPMRKRPLTTRKKLVLVVLVVAR